MGLFSKKSTNPMFQDIRQSNVSDTFTSRETGVFAKTEVFTAKGAMAKVLFGLAIIVGIYFFMLFNNSFTFFVLRNFRVFCFISIILNIGLIIYARKSPTNAKYAYLLYAILEGVLLGALTIIFDLYYPGIAVSALLMTLCVVGLMAFVYSVKPEIVTDRFRSMMGVALGAILVFYLISFAVSFFAGKPLVDYYSPISVVISIVVVVIASLMLLLDFKAIDELRKSGASKDYEWIAAFGTLVTIVWIYVEILRLLSKLRKR